MTLDIRLRPICITSYDMVEGRKSLTVTILFHVVDAGSQHPGTAQIPSDATSLRKPTQLLQSGPILSLRMGSRLWFILLFRRQGKFFSVRPHFTIVC